MVTLQNFPEVKLFHNVVTTIGVYPHLGDTTIQYRPKIKLHGRNAGVQIKDGKAYAQTRDQLLEKNDGMNAGFFDWVEKNRAYFERMPDSVIFGEWAGFGVVPKNKNSAISRVQKKIFAVFAVLIQPDLNPPQENSDLFIVGPEAIKAILNVPGHPEDLYILPWYHDGIRIENLKDTSQEGLQVFANATSLEVQELEALDPWVKETFGVEGCAEGLVYYPLMVYPEGMPSDMISYKRFEDLAFKAKGEAHSVVKQRVPVEIAPEILASRDAFIEKFITAPRLEQGVSVVGLDMSKVKQFIDWMTADIKKESADELAVSGMKWEDMEKGIAPAARTYYIVKVKANV